MSGELFSETGVETINGVLKASTCDAIARRIQTSTKSGGSRRLLDRPWCHALADRLRHHDALSSMLPSSFVAVQCTYFEKSRSRNWAVAPHQDLSVPVAERVQDAQLIGWSQKEQTLYVQAPTELLVKLVAVRVHLDDCAEIDGPLKVWPRSHAQGRLAPLDIFGMARLMPSAICTLRVGDAVVMRPLLVHASSKSHGTGRRRLLHFLFGPSDPGFGLRWQQGM